MKRLILFYLFFMCLPMNFEKLWASEQIEYETYKDSNSMFEVKYPRILMALKTNGEFVSGDSSKDRVYMNVRSGIMEEERTWEWEFDYHLNTDPYGGNDKEITYKIFKKHFFVISGLLNDEVFYEKEIPVENNGKRFLLTFYMSFPQKEKEKWESILTVCAKSFKVTKSSKENNITVGWKESPEESFKNKLVRKAKQWAEDNLQCNLSSDFYRDPFNNKTNLGKCFVDEKSIPFFNLKTTASKQFLLSVHGPLRASSSLFLGDFKYVLFTFENEKLRGEVLHQIKEGEMPGFHDPIEIVEVPGGIKLLALEIAGEGGRGSNALVFRAVNNKMKEVLDYWNWADESKPGQGDGMESLLLPQKNGDLRIFRHKWKLPESDASKDSEETRDNYSEIFYRFDSSQEKYLPLNQEKQMLNKTASIEWKSLNK